MDFNALQHKLFEMDPSDPAEDLRKLAAQANGDGADVPPTKDYVAESVDVPQGSMPLGIDSVADFAALAGVNLDEKQKMGSAGQAKGKDPMPKAEPGRTKHPLKDKLVGEDWKAAWQAGKDNYNKLNLLKKGADAMDSGSSKDDSANVSSTKDNKSVSDGVSIGDLSKGDSFKDSNGMVWYYNPREKNWRSKDRKQTLSVARGFRMWKNSQSPRKRNVKEEQIEALESRVAYLESVIESLLEGKDNTTIKARDPNAQYMNDLRKSGAMGAHKDKKKDAKAGKVKHKGKQYESIKDELWAKLNGFNQS